MKRDKLVSYLRKTLGISVRTSGFLGLVRNNCVACSAYPDNIEPAIRDNGEVIDRLDRLIVALEGREQ